MSHYTMSNGQRKFIQRMHADNKALDRCCDCPGCDTCAGFITGCTCSDSGAASLPLFAKARAQKEGKNA